MKLISWNVNGIRAVLKKAMFLPLVEKYQPDIICLQETKAAREQVSLELPGYEMYWNSAEKKGYSGTAIFTKIKPLQVSNGFSEKISQKYGPIADSYGDSGSEGRVLTAEFDNFYLVNVYTPNAKDDLSRIPLRYKHWDPAFLAHCKELEKKKPVILCGDLNVAHTPDDLARPKENEGLKGFTVEERKGFDNMLAAGFVDTFRVFHTGKGFYTWWSNWSNARARNIGWRIDYFLVSKKILGKVIKADIFSDIFGSDHCPIGVELE